NPTPTRFPPTPPPQPATPTPNPAVTLPTVPPWRRQRVGVAWWGPAAGWRRQRGGPRGGGGVTARVGLRSAAGVGVGRAGARPRPPGRGSGRGRPRDASGSRDGGGREPSARRTGEPAPGEYERSLASSALQPGANLTRFRPTKDKSWQPRQ